jgi:hypothetical protein
MAGQKRQRVRRKARIIDWAEIEQCRNGLKVILTFRLAIRFSDKTTTCVLQDKPAKQ